MEEKEDKKFESEIQQPEPEPAPSQETDVPANECEPVPPAIECEPESQGPVPPEYDTPEPPEYPEPGPPSLEEEWAEVLKEEIRSVPPVAPPRPGGPEPPLGNQAGGPEPPERAMPSTYLGWAVAATILCCLIPGVVAIVYASSVSSKYYAGDYEGAERASRNAQIWIIVSVVTGIIWGSLYIPFMLLMG